MGGATSLLSEGTPPQGEASPARGEDDEDGVDDGVAAVEGDETGATLAPVEPFASDSAAGFAASVPVPAAASAGVGAGVDAGSAVEGVAAAEEAEAATSPLVAAAKVGTDAGAEAASDDDPGCCAGTAASVVGAEVMAVAEAATVASAAL